MGGVHLVPLPDGTIQLLLWWCPIAPHIYKNLVTFAKAMVTITNIDLQLVTSVAQNDILVQQANIREATIHNLLGNTATVWL
jgi:hypothetical protein